MTEKVGMVDFDGLGTTPEDVFVSMWYVREAFRNTPQQIWVRASAWKDEKGYVTVRTYENPLYDIKPADRLYREENMPPMMYRQK